MPLAIALVWVSNPISMAPMMYFTYQLGTWMLNQPNIVKETPASAEAFFSHLATIWQPLLLGSIVTGVSLGLLGFMLVRIYWRWKVAKDWSMRKLRNRLKRKTKQS